MNIDQQTTNGIVEIMLVVITALLTHEKGKKALKQLKDSFQPHDSIIRAEIQKSIDELRIKTGATRANIWQASNGTDSFAGYSYKYLDIIFESYDESNTAPIKKKFSRTPVEDYLPLLVEIQQSDRFYIGTSDGDLPILRAAYEAFGVDLGIDYKFDNKDVYKGFISLSFANRSHYNDEVLKEVEQTAAYVYSLIKKIKNKK